VQTSSTANTFLDWANQEIFIPNGLYAVLVQFKDMIHGQQQEPLNMLSQKLGRTLFTTEQIEINRPVSATEFHPSSTIIKVELPQIAQLVYPGLYSGANKVIREGRAESEGIQGKLKSAGAWVQDRRENKAQDSNVSLIPWYRFLYSQCNSRQLETERFCMLSFCSWAKWQETCLALQRCKTSRKESQTSLFTKWWSDWQQTRPH
jgi:hypothetical protein